MNAPVLLEGPVSSQLLVQPEESEASALTGTAAVPTCALDHALRYQADFWQRGVLFLDILRERANNMLAHERAGLPPLLHFESEMILDARTFASPANYALLRITACGTDHLERFVREGARPVIVLDPRAGHGPGIGGFKRDSEVGAALRLGHPVYFVIFFPEPCPGQTLADVHHALRRFVKEVAQRHPGKPPALYGNCQAGWATALLSADCVGLAGPAVLNGSPLSYWAGESDVNPMRLAGGLLGGAWLAELFADLGDGRFDGAWLVQNFENLNPASALWEKNDRVFADPEGERERFLEFERWWSGFYFLSREEIATIVENLFIGNQLEEGRFRICESCVADLRRIRNPLVIFASGGDNITPPHQALNWIARVYRSTDELKAAGQRIVYLINPHVGHLGIFVSASVALREHRAILENLDAFEGLEPGLYEMKLEDASGDSVARAPSARFEPRRVEDVCFGYPRERFEKVRALSEANVELYRRFLAPWVRAVATPWGAALGKWFHPMRASRWMFSERFNPWMAWVGIAAQNVRENRQRAGAANPFLLAERELSREVGAALERWRKVRDAAQEDAFRTLYG
ncbi:MAG: DUF3141 domain-containing protein [Betaproteobacteria bacterium]|nr:DUF3141 domain-containing protein [Betaproteobacteria bacterium]